MSRFGSAILLLAVALGGCKRDPGPQPIAPEPEPARVPEVVTAPPPVVPTFDSWTPLLRLVPRTQFVAGADVVKLRQSPIWSERIDALAASAGADFEGMVSAAKTCGASMHDVKRVVMAGDLEGASDPMVAVEARGIGDRPLLDCIVRAKQLPAEWRGSTLVLESGKTHVIPQSLDVIVVVKEAWLPRIQAAQESNRAAPDPEVELLLDRVDMGAGAWVVGSLPTTVGGPFTHVKQFAVTFDTTIGLGVAAWLGIDPGHADSVRQQLQTQLEGMGTSLQALGMSEGIVRSISLSTVGDGVVIHARASDVELRATMDKLQKL